MNFVMLALLWIWLCQVSGLRKGLLCGVAKGGGDMVTGGREADPNEYPWTVHITISYPRNTNKQPQMCGGSLIDDTRIVTAAHCFFSGNMKFQSATLTLGAHNTRDYTGDEVFIPATPADVIIHPDYKIPSLKSNDIAIVFILHPEDQAEITNHPKISPICLPNPPPYQDHDGTYAVAVGWGKTSLLGPPSPVLLEVDLTIVSLVECRNSYSATEYSRIFLNSIDKVICAGRGDRKGDTCKGDSGGPLMLYDSRLRQHELLGVTSFGIKCDSELYPGVYTSVEDHLDWIEEQQPVCRVPSGLRVVFSHPGEHQLVKNTLLSTLPTLGKEWKISFQFKPTNYDFKDWTNLVHLTVGGNHEHYGDRTPAIFFKPDRGLVVSSSINGENNNYVRTRVPTPPVNQWTTVTVSQIKSDCAYVFKVEVNGAEAWSMDNSQAREFTSVKVYASDPFYNAHPGSIRAFTILTQ